MSQDSPRETEELEPAPQSPDDHELLQPDGDMSRVDDQGDHGPYDFEVKEQDRWLPIANVAYPGLSLSLSSRCLCDAIPNSLGAHLSSSSATPKRPAVHQASLHFHI
ncbi:transcriptional activator hap3 [Friedmanniomyces endolithicus]|nr:transcriptional activator hap3 [Friedmanniomyces endolithicus]